MGSTLLSWRIHRMAAGQGSSGAWGHRTDLRPTCRRFMSISVEGGGGKGGRGRGRGRKERLPLGSPRRKMNPSWCFFGGVKPWLWLLGHIFYMFAYCGFSGWNPHLTAKKIICCSPSTGNQEHKVGQIRYRCSRYVSFVP